VKRIVVFTLILMISSGVIFAQNSEGAKSPEAGNAYNDGLDQARKGNFKAAVPLFEKAIKAEAEFGQAYYMLGYSQRRLNMNTEAMNSFKKAIEIDKKFEKAYIALGNIQASMESYESSINSFNAVLAFNDKSAKAYYGVGNVFYQQKKYADAIDRLKKAVKNDPEYDLAWNILGLSQEKENQLSDAVNSLESAVKASKKNSRKGINHYRLGNVLLKMKNYNKAETAFLNALKFSKSQSIVGGANFGLGEVYKFLGQKQNAIRHYEKAARNRSWKASADYEIDLLKNPDKYVK
jgi:tetratricopeptide (TPR) repeat protein